MIIDQSIQSIIIIIIIITIIIIIIITIIIIIIITITIIIIIIISSSRLVTGATTSAVLVVLLVVAVVLTAAVEAVALVANSRNISSNIPSGYEYVSVDGNTLQISSALQLGLACQAIGRGRSRTVEVSVAVS